MGTKAFLAADRRRPALARLPARVLAAAGLATDLVTPSIAAPRSDSVRARATSPAPARPSVILGIDPGTLVVGYGAVSTGSRSTGFLSAGVVRADRRATVPERLATIQRRLREILEEIRPDLVVVERAFAAKNVQSALRIGEGRGVALACAAAFGAEVVEMPPASAKKSVVGHGSAGKDQVARMVAVALGLREPPRPLDASDALALALAVAFDRTGAFGPGRTRTPAIGRERRAT